MIKNMTSMLPLVLQMYGSILLLFKFVLKKIEYKDVKNAEGGGFDYGIDDKYFLKTLKKSKYIREVVRSRISFVCIIVGYILSIILSFEDLNILNRGIGAVIDCIVLSLLVEVLTRIGARIEISRIKK